MAKISGRKRGRIASRLAAAAVTAALVGTGASAFAADNPSAKPFKAPTAKPAKSALTSAQASNEGDAPIYGLYGVDKSNTAWYYAPNGNGGLEGRVGFEGNTGWGQKWIGQVDHNADSLADGIWQADYSGNLYYAANDGSQPWKVGGGWNTYNTLLSPGNLGGAGAGDLLGRDGSGNLYLYLGYGDGKMTSRYLVGGGWGQYTQLAGNSDLTGDGKADIVARGGDGTLWLYKGTGNYKAPFEGRTKIGGGWNTYNTIFAAGDIDLDGKADLIGRDASGALYLYKGTGNAASPFASRVKIGTSGWNTYRLFF
ncbi:VCBS repeat-containing protein [Streptomyces sp. BPTC-684]|uniref:FG-GAP repeat domain-containing protein n=1 Tax=Streptomyces sp. BPTC-684 TaxID=3043734 RepID=UPI0024B23A0B|nr:VCBS repeat-containing protein [Streptomyces sp. BPTC-684]WHM35958.1 VCBS repeat-containing protein [Streptomyces sp. BPTC-684]